MGITLRQQYCPTTMVCPMHNRDGLTTGLPHETSTGRPSVIARRAASCGERNLADDAIALAH
jgi:hypothetical protein